MLYKRLLKEILGPLCDPVCRDSLSMIHWILTFSRLGKIRIRRWYTTASLNEKLKSANEAIQLILPRPAALCSFIDYKDYKLVYRRYASLYFCICMLSSLGIDQDDNELSSWS
jgi:AP-1 complex subunit sigma 1/2